MIFFLMDFHILSTTHTTRAFHIKKALLVSVIQSNFVWSSGNIFNRSSSIGVSLLSPSLVSTTCLNLEADFHHSQVIIVLEALSNASGNIIHHSE
jgi:hypothetical protein